MTWRKKPRNDVEEEAMRGRGDEAMRGRGGGWVFGGVSENIQDPGNESFISGEPFDGVQGRRGEPGCSLVFIEMD